MNNITLLFYLAEISMGLKMISLLAGFVLAVAAVLMAIDRYGNAPHPWLTYILLGVFLVLGIITPSYNTVMFMSASEITQDVAESPLGEKIYKKLDRWLEED